MKAMKVSQNKYILPGQAALAQQGRIIWVGALSSPWEDVECDEIIVCPADYECVRMRTLPTDFSRADHHTSESNEK